MKRFEDYFQPQKYNYPTLTITKSTADYIENFVRRIVERKSQESIHQIDSGMEEKRWFTGISGEMAVEKLLGVAFVDWNIGESSKFNIADLTSIGMNVGIKTAEYGKFPVIHKKAYRPEIIVVKQDNRFFVCGLASKEVLSQYQDDELILSKKLRERNVKTGFYGFHRLQAFRSLAELKEIVSKRIAS